LNAKKIGFAFQVVKEELFSVLRDKWGGNLHSFILEKVAAVPGDISCENMRVTDSNLREEMMRTIDIILNFAATTKFDERYSF
jgi:alcohol-forming fatty acyl-CoA reductase